MSRCFQESFDGMATNADITAKGWTTSTATIVPTALAARTGPNGAIVTSATALLSRSVATSLKHGTFIVGFFAKAVGAVSNALSVRFYGDAGATLHSRVDFNTDGSLTAYRNTTSLGSAAGVWNPTAGSYIEIKTTLSDTVGVIEVRVNGSPTPVLNLTGIDTKNAGTATVFDTVGWLGGASASVAWGVDDIYCNNGAGTTENNFEGDVAVSKHTVNGAGATTGLTASSGAEWETLDEGPGPVLTDYVESATNDAFSTYSVENVPAGTTIKGPIQVVAYAAKTDVGAKSLAHVIRSNGINTTLTDQSLSTSPAYYQELTFDTGNAGAAWTETTFNAVEIGPKVRP